MKSAASWHDRAAALRPETRAFIGGHFTEAAAGATFATVDPATGRVVAEVAECGAEDVDRAVAAARAAFDGGVWSRAAPAVRKAALLRLADLIERDGEEIALLETLDVGKPIRDSLTVDVPASAKCVRWFAEAVDKLYDEVAPTDPAVVAMIRRVAVGVVAAVVPWNFPLVMALTKIAPALAAGNSVVLKPAEQSPLTAIKLAALASEAGLPDGVLNVVPGYGETAGAALGLHMDVDALLFTGSTAIGKRFLEYSARSNMKKVGLECGGKSANIVLADCPDIDAAAKAAAGAIFFNQGEICNAGSRLVLAEPIRDAFLDRLLSHAADWSPGDPLDPETRMGALISHDHMRRVLGFVEGARRDGCDVLCGGAPVREDSGGTFLPPTVLDRVQNTMTVAREEVFGPVLSVITVKDTDEAVAVANDSPYGLAAAVWTRDLATAHRVDRALMTGFVWVNTVRVGDMTTPFGGMKQSGLGRDKSLHAFDEVTDLKTTWIQT